MRPSQDTTPPAATRDARLNERRIGLDDPRAIEILTAEHWSLLSSRTLGYQEMFGRTTIFVAVLSATVVALALLAEATHFSRETLSLALLLISVVLFIGLATFVRCVAINWEDARWVTGMNLLRQAYLKIVPDLEPFFLTDHTLDARPRLLGYGSPQRFSNIASSLTTTSGVVAALNSVLAGSLASGVCAMFAGGLTVDVAVGGAVSLASAVLHARYAARVREARASHERALHDQADRKDPGNRNVMQSASR